MDVIIQTIKELVGPGFMVDSYREPGGEGDEVVRLSKVVRLRLAPSQKISEQVEQMYQDVSNALTDSIVFIRAMNAKEKEIEELKKEIQMRKDMIVDLESYKTYYDLAMRMKHGEQ